MHLRTSVFSVAIALSTIACTAPDDQPRFIVSDSAGVEIVTSSAPAWDPVERWAVDSVPLLEVGVVDGNAEYLFDRIRGVVVLDDGGIAVANEGTATIRFYDSQGQFRFERGGKGGGPEEFFQILRLYRLGDGIVAQQWGPNPTRMYALDGTLTASFPSSASAMPGPRVIEFFSDGAALFMQFPQGQGITEPTVQKAQFYVTTPEETQATRPILSLPAIRYMPVERRQAPQDLGPLLSVEVDGDLIYYGWPEEYDIQSYDRNGQLLRRIRRSWEPTPILKQHIETYVRMMTERDWEMGGPPPEEYVARLRRMLDQMIYPESFPAFDRLMLDRVGNVWARTTEEADLARYVPTSSWPVPSVPATWDVFDTTGVWLGSLELPARLHVSEIGDEYVAGVWLNELGVEFVHVYALRKPPSP